MTRSASLSVLLLALAGCIVDNGASVRVAAICATPDDATACAFESECSAEYIGQNLLDVTYGNPLWLFVQVDNQLRDNSNLDTGRLNTNVAWVQEYEVEYDGVALPMATGPILGSAEVLTEGSSVISVLPINEAILAILGGASSPIPAGGSIDIVAKLRLKGVFGDTTKFETAEFKIPIRVCDGCLTYGACPNLGELLFFCPQPGQAPTTATCAAP